MVTKFSQKAAAIHFNLPSAEEQQTRPEAATRQRPRTAVGSHVDALYRDRELADEADRLRANLKDFEGSLPTKPLDPNDVVLSRFANRHPDSYCDHEFHALRDEIQAAGGNIQPIKVRPIPHRPGKYELSLTAADFETDPARISPKHVLEQLAAAAAGGEGVSQKATAPKARSP